MNITVDKDAADYIRKHSKDKSVTLFMKSSRSCCCSIQVPTILLSKPPIANNYDVYNVNEISVYIRKDTQTENNAIRVFLRKFLWVKDLAVDGMKINF